MAVLFYPYLPFAGRCSVGDWELISADKLQKADVVEGLGVEMVKRLPDLYEVPSLVGNVGAFARPKDGQVGGGFEEETMRRLGRSLTLAVLSGNPDTLLPEDELTGNEGHVMMTSDNAIGYGHPLGPDGGVAVEYGAMASTLVGGLKRQFRRTQNCSTAGDQGAATRARA